MKYIVTSSLNVENVLSTESISPLSFYGKRSFGYKTFYQIDELKAFDCILLFSEIPFFVIEDEQRENHPMIIQIDDERQISDAKEVGEYSGCKVYAYTKTIHINPVNTKLLFFTDKARVLSYHNCLDSKMCKMHDYFCFQTVQPSRIKLKDLVRSVKSSLYRADDTTETDNSHNRVKGFILGYFIGAIKSLSPNTAKMLAIQKRIYDIAASIKNNDGKSNTTFDAELLHLDREYAQLDPNILSLKKYWKEQAEKHRLPVDGLNAFLNSFGMEVSCKHVFSRKIGIIMRKTLSEYRKPEELEIYSKDMMSHINSLIYQERNDSLNRIKLKSLLDISPDYSLAMMAQDDKDNSLFNKILSKIVWSNVINDLDVLRINRFDVATRVTQIVKNITEEEGKVWKDSAEQLYFHHLRENIRNFTPFNLQEVSNIILQSLAAFLLKGEDFEALVGYLENNSMPTYQYALSLWGATLGYVQIPRSTVFTSMKKSTFEQFYKDAYSLMYRRELEVNITVANRNNALAGETNAIKEYSHAKSQPETEQRKDLNTAIPVNVTENFSIRQKKVHEIAESITKDKKMVNDVDNALAQMESNMDNLEQFMNLLLESPHWKTKKGQPNKKWKDLKKRICNDDTLKGQGTLWDDERFNNILSETSWIEDSAKLIDDRKAWKQFKIDAKWFVDNHKESYYDDKKGKQPGRYFNKSKSNEQVIERFQTYMENKLHSQQKNMEWLADIYKNIPIKKIINYLSERYGI